MMPSRGMGVINPSKMPKARKVVRKDGPEPTKLYKKGGKTGSGWDSFTPEEKAAWNENANASAELRRIEAEQEEARAQNARELRRSPVVKQATGGKVPKSKVNEAGNYTKPGMRESLFKSIKAQAVQGTGAGQWSARKAQLLAKEYKAKGGGYKG